MAYTIRTQVPGGKKATVVSDDQLRQYLLHRHLVDGSEQDLRADLTVVEEILHHRTPSQLFDQLAASDYDSRYEAEHDLMAWLETTKYRPAPAPQEG